MGKRKEKGFLTVVVVIAHNHFFNLSKFTHFAPKILIESIKVVLQLHCIHLDLWIIGGILV